MVCTGVTLAKARAVAAEAVEAFPGEVIVPEPFRWYEV